MEKVKAKKREKSTAVSSVAKRSRLLLGFERWKVSLISESTASSTVGDPDWDAAEPVQRLGGYLRGMQ